MERHAFTATIIISLIMMVAIVAAACTSPAVPSALPPEHESPPQEILASQGRQPFEEKEPVVGLSISQLVSQLDYSEDTGRALTQMVDNWLDQQRKPAYITWKIKLNDTRESLTKEALSEQELVKTELNLVKEVSQRINSEIGFREVSYTARTFDLPEIIKQRKSNCLGYSQLFYILGNSLGLPVDAIAIAETPVVPGGHVACIARLANGQVVIISIPNVSQEFVLEETFARTGIYWELRDKLNPLGLEYTRFRILNKDGLIALRYYSQGNDVYAVMGQYDKAVSEYNWAIQLNPQCTEAYTARGVAYFELEQYDGAIADYSRSIALNPLSAMTYSNRGLAYCGISQFNKAIEDCSKAIELNPQYGAAYLNRGIAYILLRDFDKAILDLNNAKTLDPNLTENVEKEKKLIEKIKAGTGK